jgi:pimeloyl-ACP methyl ester carboxylesterase
MAQYLGSARDALRARTLRWAVGLGLLAWAMVAGAAAPPSQTATIVVRGFDKEGASHHGVYGADTAEDTVQQLAATVGLPTSDVAPYAPNQVAYANYYGNTPPPYYTAQDIADVAAVTATYGGGVPRYALITAKYAKEVMRRSGAQQITLFGVSMGGLVSRWIVEKDVEHLVSEGRVARWIIVEGVVGGNWICSEGGSSLRDAMRDLLDLDPIDLQHMSYSWIETHLHNPSTEADNPLLGLVPIHIWIPSDDNYHSYALTLASQKPNDGVQLLRDTFFHALSSQSKYLGLPPTRSCVHATHESSKDHLGLRAGIAADLFGRRRVTVTLKDVYVVNPKERSGLGNGEFVFGVSVYSPKAQERYGISAPIHEYRYDDTNFPFYRLPAQTTSTLNAVWFDDLILPGETQLTLQTNVKEIDYDLLYEVTEDITNAYDSLSNATLHISTATSGSYSISTTDWRGTVVVAITDYPEFGPEPTSVRDWTLYE